MSRVVVFEHLTLDGVMEAQGRADEDCHGGFEPDGWARLWDPVIGSVAEEGMAWTAALGGRPLPEQCTRAPGIEREAVRRGATLPRGDAERTPGP